MEKLKMLYTKDGYPEVNEIVLCTVRKIYGNSTFVFLNEYEKEGVLTISEIAPGRIRNLRDHVSENKEIICKVLRVDEKRNRIDVSLRRVPVPVMRDKLEKLKKEEFSDKMYLDISKKIDISKDELFDKTFEPIFEEYESVFEALYDIMLNNDKISMFTELNDEQRKVFIEVVNQKIKPEEVVFKENFSLSSIDQNGVELVRNLIDEGVKEVNYEKFDVVYLAAGKFQVAIKHDDMKSADLLFKKFRDVLEQFAKGQNLDLKFKVKK